MTINRRRLVETLNAMGAAAPPPPDTEFVRALEERLIALQTRGPEVRVVEGRSRRRAPLRMALLAAGLVAASGAAALVAPPVVRHIRSALRRSVPTPPSSTRPPLLPASVPSSTVSIAEPVPDTTFMSATTPTMPDTPPDTQPGIPTATIAPTTPPPPTPQAEPTLTVGPTTSTTTSTTPTTTTTSTTTTSTTTLLPTSTVLAGERRIAVPILPMSCASLPSAGVRCTWSPLPPGATGRILRSIPGGSVGRVFSPPTDARSYLDTTAGPGTYGYRIQALGVDGQIVAQSELVAITVA